MSCLASSQIGFMLPKSIFTKPAAGHMGVLSPAAASGVV